MSHSSSSVSVSSGSSNESAQEEEPPQNRRTSLRLQSKHKLKTDNNNKKGEETVVNVKENRKKTEHQKENEISQRFQDSFSNVFSSLLKIILYPLNYLFTTLLPHTFAGLTAGILLISIIYLMTSSINNYFLNRIINLPNPIDILTTSMSTLTTPIVYLYCSTLQGPLFCSREVEKDHPRTDPIQLAQIARTVTGTAQKASDIFDSVIQLSDPKNLGLYQTEILELSFAIRWSSTQLNDKDLISNGLAELSDLSRQLKDQLVDLNGQGLNTFSFIAYEFSRLGDLMNWVSTGERKYTSQTIAKNLDILFEHLSTELTQLLNSIENLIPLASRSTNLGIQISERLYQEHYQLVNKKNNQGLFKKLSDLTTFSGKQLNRDLTLTSESISNLKLTWLKLESIRTDLLTYRNNVANFKASFTGWHLADHQLTPEDELFSMREVIQRFQSTIKDVKSNARSPFSTPNRLSSSDIKPDL
ncbi:hypothetical protein Pst134EA_017524 [Puccinia striiformis f. sp. tritici]